MFFARLRARLDGFAFTALRPPSYIALLLDLP